MKRTHSLLGFLVLGSVTLVACGDDDVTGDDVTDAGGSSSSGRSGSSSSSSSGSSSGGSSSSSGGSSSSSSGGSSSGDAGTDAGEDGGVVVASIEVFIDAFCNDSCSMFEAGLTRQLSARVLDVDGVELSGIPVTWESATPAVASIDAAGLASGLSEGSVEMRAHAGGVTGSMNLTILAPSIIRVELTPAHVDLATVGATAPFTAKAFNRLEQWVQDAPITWYSSDPNVGTFDASGLFTSVSQGHVIVQAAAGLASGWSSITVVSPISNRPAMVFDQVSGGAQHGCGVSGTKGYCWGWNYYGELGNGENGDLTGEGTAQAVTGGLAFSSMAAGEYHSCGITTTGAAYCWGNGGAGELGNGDDTVFGSPDPLPVVGGLSFVQLAAGGSHTCGITTAGLLYCWGADDIGAVGLGTPAHYFAPQALTPTVHYTDVVTGLDHTCALRNDKTVACWGSNLSYAVGTGADDGATVATPTDLPGGHHFANIDSYGTHTCGVEVDQSIWCWGRNDTAQSGNGLYTDNPTPVKMDTALTFSKVTTGAHHTCALTTAGQTWCVGDGSYGQLGTGLLDFSSHVVQVLGGQTFIDIEAGSHFTCGRLASKATYCWGASSSGQLGGGYAGDAYLSTVPSPMAIPE